MSGISTHILDMANGKAAAGVSVSLYCNDKLLNTETTNADGRVPVLLSPDTPFVTGVYRLVFQVGGYFVKSFFPEVVIVFEVTDATAHYHVPLLLSPFGYSTYRGT